MICPICVVDSGPCLFLIGHRHFEIKPFCSGVATNCFFWAIWEGAKTERKIWNASNFSGIAPALHWDGAATALLACLHKPFVYDTSLGIRTICLRLGNPSPPKWEVHCCMVFTFFSKLNFRPHCLHPRCWKYWFESVQLAWKCRFGIFLSLPNASSGLAKARTPHFLTTCYDTAFFLLFS